MRSNNSRSSRRRRLADKKVSAGEVVEPRMLLSANPIASSVNRDAPVNDGIVNGSFEASNATIAPTSNDAGQVASSNETGDGQGTNGGSDDTGSTEATDSAFVEVTPILTSLDS